MLCHAVGCVVTRSTDLSCYRKHSKATELGKLTSACTADETDRLNMVLSRLPASCMRMGQWVHRWFPHERRQASSGRRVSTSRRTAAEGLVLGRRFRNFRESRCF